MGYLYLTLLFLISLVITADTALKCVLWLVATYIMVGSLIFTTGFTYLGLVYVLVYAGALTILFIFAIILSD